MKKLKKCKQLSFIAIVGLLFGISSISDVNAMTTMPEAVDGVITLTEDVTLTEKFAVASDKTITIDLNGHTLTGPTDNYTIDNEGNLTIIDKGATKGEISSSAPSSACVHNNNTMKIDGVTITSAKFIAVKNEPNSTATIDNSNLTGGYRYKQNGALMNYGTATVNNSTIKSTNRAAAIYIANNDSTTIVNNSTLSAKKSGSSSVFTETSTSNRTFTMNNGTVEGKVTLDANVDKKLTGNITTNYINNDILSYATSGTTITTSQSVAPSDDITVPSGVTLKIPADNEYTIDDAGSLKVLGTLDVEGTINNNVYNEKENTYYATLANAMANAKENDKLVLNADVTEATDVVNTTNVELDLNSKTLTGNITNSQNATLKITDNSEEAKGKVDGTITNDGNLTLENGNYTNIPTTNTDATTVINGGTYPADQIDKAEIPDNTKFVQNDDGTYSLEELANIKELENILKKLEKLTEKDYEKYTEKSLKNFLKNLEEAENLLNSLSDEPTVRDQQTIDKITKLLTDGYNGLVKKQTSHTATSNKNQKEETNPQTFDDTKTYIVLGTIALAGTIASGLYLRKNSLA